MALVGRAVVSHWSALIYHGLTEQTPREVFVLITTESSDPADVQNQSPRYRRRLPGQGHDLSVHPSQS